VCVCLCVCVYVPVCLCQYFEFVRDSFICTAELGCYSFIYKAHYRQVDKGNLNSFVTHAISGLRFDRRCTRRTPGSPICQTTTWGGRRRWCRHVCRHVVQAGGAGMSSKMCRLRCVV